MAIHFSKLPITTYPQVRTLTGIRFLELSSGTERSVITRKQYMMLAVEVFLHLLIFAGVPAGAMYSLLNIQTVYAMTTASTATPALMGWDLLLRPTHNGVFLGYDIAPVVAIGWSIMLG